MNPLLKKKNQHQKTNKIQKKIKNPLQSNPNKMLAHKKTIIKRKKKSTPMMKTKNNQMKRMNKT